MKKIGVLQFPGSNCDPDVFQALKRRGAELLPAHRPLDIRHYRAFVLPGGFSYGDYLRPGALAAFSPALRDLIQAVQKGCPVLGICNGFQILCEAGLLPGALLPNHSGRFIDGWMGLDLGADIPFWPAATAAGKEEQGLQDRLGKRVFLSVSEKISEAQIKGLTAVAKRLTRLPTT